VDHHLVDKATQERLLLLGRQQVLPPQFRELLPGPDKGFPVLGAERFADGRLQLLVPAALVSVLEFAQGRLPTPLQFSGHQAIIRVRLVELPFGQTSLVAEAFELLLPCLLHLFGLLA